MPKRNIYVSEGLDELIAAHETPIPLASLFQDAVIKYMETGLCPTCGQQTDVKEVKKPTHKAEAINARPVKQCKNDEEHDAHNFKRGGLPYRCPGVQ